MAAMDVNFIDVVDGEKDFSKVEATDVVILPAFGASVKEMRSLSERGVQIIDTTCPWVSKVWNAVDKQAAKAHTSIIHGKYSHEETVATASFAGDYVIVKDMKEAEYVSEYILNGGNRDEFLAKFSNAGTLLLLQLLLFALAAAGCAVCCCLWGVQLLLCRRRCDLCCCLWACDFCCGCLWNRCRPVCHVAALCSSLHAFVVAHLQGVTSACADRLVDRHPADDHWHQPVEAAVHALWRPVKHGQKACPDNNTYVPWLCLPCSV
jgi:hypothetical protein